MDPLFDPVRGVSEPDRVWCITNVAEATPDLLSPLCWSVWGHAIEAAWLESLRQFGVLSRAEAVPSENPNDHSTSAIFARQAFNVDVVLAHVARIPGVKPDDFERDIMGSVRESRPPVKGRPQRIPVIALRMPATMLRAHRRLHRLAPEVRDWWRRDVFAVDRGQRTAQGSPHARLLFGRDQFRRAMTIHVMVRMQFQAVQSALADAAAKAGDPTLASRVLAGAGNVTEVRLADDLWRMAQGDLAEEDFLAEHGYHGPHEGNVYTRSWREDPEPVRASARAMAGRGDLTRPRDRREVAVSEGARAQAELLAAVPRLQRPLLRFLLARAANIVRNVEVGKSAYVMGIDGCRAAARHLGRDLVAAGRLAEVDDVFFLTLEELRLTEDGALPEARDLIAFRRAAREEYRAITLPPFFTGMPEPVTTDLGHPAGGLDEIAGAASGGGVVTGRARVVLDPNGDAGLEAGDILVCRFTDPSWAPLFTMAEALVIDLGGAASHGAVVARELGIPFVIGTGDGTTVIRDGDRILVDGTQNVVRVLERA